MRREGKFGRGFSFGLLVTVAAGVVSCLAADGTWNWDTSEALNGTTPTNMALWSTSANWVDSAPPSGDTAVAYLVPSNRTTSMAPYGARYIRVPDEGVDIGEINIRQYATLYLTGGPVRFGTRSTLNASMPRIRDEGTTCTAYYYCPIDFTRMGTTLNRAYFCGPVLYQVGGRLANSGDVRYYANAWATNTDTVVTNPFPDAIFSPGSGNCYYLPRMSAGAQTGTWQTFLGSPVLLRTGAVHDLAAGATVSGEGIPEGAFVRRIYSSSAIELSASCTADSGAGGVTVAFGAFQNVRTIQHVTRLQNQGGTVLSHCFSKYRAEDIFDVHVDDVGSLVNLTMASDNQRSFAANQGAYYPARIFLKSASSVGANYIRIQNTHLIFDPEDGATFFLNAADLGNSVSFDTWGPRLETPAGVTATIQNIRRWTLTATKDGEGTLDITSTNIAHNALIAEKGLTVLRMTAPTANQTFASITVSNGASLKLAEGTLAVSSAAFGSGATLIAGEGAVLDISGTVLPAGITFKGPGTFVVKEASALSGAVLEDAPVFRFANAGTTRDLASTDEVIPAVVGHPAFWVDAAKNVDLMTFEWEGVTYTNGVACWRDCRDGETAYYATNDFSQLTVKTGVPSRYEANRYNGLPCVLHAGIATAADPNPRTVQSGMVWNRPITNVCAVFHVVYNYDNGGGNAMLGCTKRFAEMGTARDYNDFGRGINGTTDGGGVGTWSNYLLASGVPAWIRNGWLYVNGQEWDLSVKMPSTVSIPYVLEAHPLAPYGRADAFAIQEHAGVTSSGCQRQMECIVYTNQLTLTERRQVCAYLMQKHRNATVDYDLSDSRFTNKSNLDTLDASRDVGIDVAAGTVMGFTTLTNNATLLKTGAGTLYADLVDGASFDVREGEVVIRSQELTADVVPPGPFVHLDAIATNRMTLTPKTYLDGETRVEVTHWRDVSGASPVSAQRRTTDDRYKGPYLSYPESLGGRPVVDYGVLTNTSPLDINYGWGLFHDLVWKETDGFSTMNYTNLTTLGSVFLMIGSKNGGGVPFGGYATSPWRNATVDPAVPFFNANAPTGSRSGGNWLNGAKTTFTTAGLSGGYDLVSFRDTVGTGCNVQSLMMANGRAFTGGGELGEVLVYEEPLSYYKHQIVDAWLNWKWFARKTVGYAPSAASNVTVAAGATLTVEGGSPLTVTRLSGTGAIDGSVSFASGAELVSVIHDNGTITPLTVSGTADLSAGGTVTLTGDISKLTQGAYLLVSCPSVTAGLWNVEYTGTTSLKYVVRARPDGIYLDVVSPGTLIIFQ